MGAASSSCVNSLPGPASRLDDVSNDYEFTIRVTKALEHALEVGYGATGSGLHERVTSAHALPGALGKRLRFVATVRNKLVHEHDTTSLPEGFRAAALQALAELQRDGPLLRHAAGTVGSSDAGGGSSCIIA